MQVSRNHQKISQALNFVPEGAQKLSSFKGHFFEEIVNLYWNFAKGTPAKAQGTMAIAVDAEG